MTGPVLKHCPCQHPGRLAPPLPPTGPCDRHSEGFRRHTGRPPFSTPQSAGLVPLLSHQPSPTQLRSPVLQEGTCPTSQAGLGDSPLSSSTFTTSTPCTSVLISGSELSPVPGTRHLPLMATRLPSMRAHSEPRIVLCIFCTAELLNLSPIDVLGQITLCCGAALCTTGCLAANTASTYQMPAAAPAPKL